MSDRLGRYWFPVSRAALKMRGFDYLIFKMLLEASEMNLLVFNMKYTLRSLFIYLFSQQFLSNCLALRPLLDLQTTKIKLILLLKALQINENIVLKSL